MLEKSGPEHPNLTFRVVPVFSLVIAPRSPTPSQHDRHSGTPPARRRANARSRMRAAEAANAHDRPHAITLSLPHSRSHPLFSLLQTIISHSLSLSAATLEHTHVALRQNHSKRSSALSQKLRLGLRNPLSPVVSQSVASSTSTPLAATSPPPACFFLLLCAAQIQQQTQQQQMRIAQPTAIPTIRPIMDDWQTL